MHLGEHLHSLVYTDTDSVLFIANECDWEALLDVMNKDWIPSIFGTTRDQCVVNLRMDKVFPGGVKILGKGKLE